MTCRHCRNGMHHERTGRNYGDNVITVGPCPYCTPKHDRPPYQDAVDHLWHYRLDGFESECATEQQARDEWSALKEDAR